MLDTLEKRKVCCPLYSNKRNLMIESYGHLHAVCTLHTYFYIILLLFCHLCLTLSTFFFLQVLFITLLYANSLFLFAFVYIKLHSPLLSFQENNISSLPKHNRGFSVASPLLTLLNLQTSASIMNLQLN